MVKYSKLFLTIIFTLSLTFLLVKFSLAQQSYSQGSTLFSDDFSSGNTNNFTQFWSVAQSGSTWSVSSSVGSNMAVASINRPSSSSAQYGFLVKSATWSDFALDTDVYDQTGVDQVVDFRYTDLNNRYELDLRAAVQDNPTSNIVLNRFQAGTVTTLYSGNYTLNPNTTYHIRIETLGTHIQIFIDSTFIFEVDDSTSTLTSGGIALGGYISTSTSEPHISAVIVRFDNINVAQLAVPTATPTPTVIPTPTNTPTPTPTPTPTLTPTPTGTPSPTPTLIPTATPTPTSTPTPSPTPTPTSAPTQTPTSLPTPTPTPTPGSWPTLALLESPTPTPFFKNLLTQKEVLGTSTTPTPQPAKDLTAGQTVYSSSVLSVTASGLALFVLFKIYLFLKAV